MTATTQYQFLSADVDIAVLRQYFSTELNNCFYT